MLRLEDLEDFVSEIREVMDKFHYARHHILEIIREKRPFNDLDIKCMILDGIITEEEIEE